MNKKKTNQKDGWTLMELCIIMVVLAILVGLSIQAIKPKKFMYLPFAYAGYYNLKQATNYVMNKCVRNDEGYAEEKIYGCQKGVYKLPVTDDAAVTAINEAIAAKRNSDPTVTDPDVTLEGTPELFCYEVANLFTLVNDGEVNCGQGKSKDTIHTSLPVGNGKGDGTDSNNKAGVPNFQASNMVSYYFLEGPWLQINRGKPEESDLTGTDISQFKPIFIDVNGDKGPNKLGEDQFPLRLYIDGTIVPGSCKLYGTADTSGSGTNSGERIEGAVPAYPNGGNLYCPPSSSWSFSASSTNPADPSNPSWLESKYPFSYALYRSYIPEGGNSDNRTTEVLLRGLSYKEAACKSGRDNVIPRKVFCNDDGSSKETNPSAKNFKTLEACQSGNNDSFCIERITRPANPGIFRLPML